MKFHKDGTLPELSPGTVFVFGSNTMGIHGAGAAKIAKDIFGAKWRQPWGFTSTNSFAIPTKDKNFGSLSLQEIAMYVGKARSIFTESKGVEFFITRIGCGLAGYRNAQIAPMFRGFPDNCSFAEEWREFLVDEKAELK